LLLMMVQVGLLEELADIHAPGPLHTTSSSSGSTVEPQPQVSAAGGSGVRAVQLAEVLPVLGERQVDQMMTRLHQVTQVRQHLPSHTVLLLLWGTQQHRVLQQQYMYTPVGT
jgi:hypothetical protein